MEDQATDVFEEHRAHVFGVAYRMLGSVVEAEDVVQDTWLRWQGVDQAQVRSPRAFLGTVASRLALDRLRSARHQRESYVGPWLPEPLVTDAADQPERWAEAADSLTFGFLCVLERLEPVERAVFLLREVFDYPYAEIATVVERSEAACRQIAHRAKVRVADEHRRAEHAARTSEEALATVTNLVVATMAGDMAGVQHLLARDVVLLSDGGPDHHAARRPVIGPHRTSRFLVNLTKRLPDTFTSSALESNGEPAVLVRDHRGRPWLLMAFLAEGGVVREIHLVRNPAKLAHLA